MRKGDEITSRIFDAHLELIERLSARVVGLERTMDDVFKILERVAPQEVARLLTEAIVESNRRRDEQKDA